MASFAHKAGSSNNNNNNDNNNNQGRFGNSKPNVYIPKPRTTNALTNEEKAAKKSKFYSGLGNFTNVRTNFNLTHFLDGWSVNIKDNFVPSHSKEGLLEASTKFMKDGIEMKSNEAYLMIFQVGYPYSMFGVGNRFEGDSSDNPTEKKEKTPEYTVLSEYTLNAEFYLISQLPQPVLDYNPKALDNIKKQNTYLHERQHALVDYVEKTPEVAPSIKAKLLEEATAFAENMKSADPNFTDAQVENMKMATYKKSLQKVYKSGLKTKEVELIDEKTKEKTKQRLDYIHFKTAAFVDNTYKEPMPADLDEYEKHPQYEKQVKMIRKAHADGKKLRKIKVLNPDGTERTGSTFQTLIKAQAIVMARATTTSYDHGINRGFGWHTTAMQVIWEPETTTGEDKDMIMNHSSLLFVAGKSRTYYEGEILKLIKANKDKTDGITVMVMKSMLVDVKPPKMTILDIQGALATLLADRFVIYGKDNEHFKLFNEDIDIDKLSIEAKPMFVSVEEDKNKININTGALTADDKQANS